MVTPNGKQTADKLQTWIRIDLPCQGANKDFREVELVVLIN